MELRGIKVEVWEEHIAVSGPLEKYTTTLLEQSPKGKPFEEFPVSSLPKICFSTPSLLLPHLHKKYQALLPALQFLPGEMKYRKKQDFL